MKVLNIKIGQEGDLLSKMYFEVVIKGVNGVTSPHCKSLPVIVSLKMLNY